MKNKSLRCENSYINLEEQFFKKNRDITVMMWFYTDKIDHESALISQNYGRSGTGRVELGVSNGKTYYFINGEELYCSNIDKNKWYHISYVIKNDTLIGYLNGKKDCEKALDDFHEDNTYLFSYLQGQDYYFNGLIDEFRIYDYALSEEEIKNKMNLVETNYSYLLRYYNFNNITKDNKVIDLTGKKDVTINNFTGLSDNVPLLKNPFKYLLKYKNNIYSIKSNLVNLGQPKSKEELNLWFKQYGENDLNILIQKLNNKSVPLINKGGIWESSAINFNEVLTTIDLVEDDENKEIKYDVKPFRILDNFKGKIEILKRVEKYGLKGLFFMQQ